MKIYKCGTVFILAANAVAAAKIARQFGSKEPVIPFARTLKAS